MRFFLKSGVLAAALALSVSLPGSSMAAATLDMYLSAPVFMGDGCEFEVQVYAVIDEDGGEGIRQITGRVDYDPDVFHFVSGANNNTTYSNYTEQSPWDANHSSNYEPYKPGGTEGSVMFTVRCYDDNGYSGYCGVPGDSGRYHLLATLTFTTDDANTDPGDYGEFDLISVNSTAYEAACSSTTTGGLIYAGLNYINDTTEIHEHDDNLGCP
jgi:hypothetical protein